MIQILKKNLKLVSILFWYYILYSHLFYFNFKLERALAKKSGKNQDCEIPIFKDPADMQAFFLKEVQISDELMQIGIEPYTFVKCHSI